MADNADLKKLLRKRYLSDRITGRVLSDSPFIGFSSFDVLLSYIPLPGEVDVTPVMYKALAMGKTVAVPSMDYSVFSIISPSWRDSLVKLGNGTMGLGGNFPTLDVKTLSTLKTLVLLPALACTSDGWRLGRGGGFYDRLMSVISSFDSVTSICVCQKEHVMDSFPAEEHDIKTDKVILV